MSEKAHVYPDPPIAVGNEAFWEAAAEGRLVLKCCRDCGEFHHYPRAICPHCFSENTEWRTAAGTGTVYSFSVMRRADPPYAIGYVTLDEGVTLMTHFVDCDLDTLAIGRKVKVAFRRSPNGTAIPVFAPA